MNPSSRTFLVTGAMLCLVLLLAACAGQPTDVAPGSGPAEVALPGTADALTREMTATHTAAADVSAARQDEKETPSTEPTTEQEAAAATSTLSRAQELGLKRLVSLVKGDLACQLTVAVDEIELVEVQEVVWADASLGCPEPGMMYEQVITDGYLVVLAAGEETYEYHTDRDQALTLCGGGALPEQPTQGIDATVKDGWPSQPRGDDVIIVPPGERKRP